MTDYSYGALGDLIKQVLDNAIQRFLYENEWYGAADRGFTGNGWDVDLPPVTGLTGTVRMKYNVMSQTDVSMPPPGSRFVGEETEGYVYYHVYEVDPWVDIYEPIADRVNEAFRGWRSLPDPADFADLKDQMVEVVNAVSPAKQADGSYTFVDVGVQSAIERLRTWVSPQADQASSDLLFAFDSAYGVGRVTGVMTNQAQVAAALGYAVAGEEKVWTKARADIMTIASDGAEAIRFDSGGAFNIDLGVVKAFLGLASVFSPPQLKLLIGGLTAGIGFLEAVIPQQQTESRELTVEGGTALDTLASLEQAIKDLEAAIADEEQEIVNKMRALGDILGDRSADDFHIHAGAGMDVPFTDAVEIRIDVPTVQEIGKRDVPTVAGAFLTAADLASGLTGSGIWSRDEMIGYGTVGAHASWSIRMADFDRMTTGSARELIEAGRLLAIAAGWIEDSDIAVHDSVRGHEDELERGQYEWTA